LRKVLGIWAEEIDSLYDSDRNALVPAPGRMPGLSGPYEVRHFCELIHSEGAEVLASYGADWYAGRPALTRNRAGTGRAYHIAARTDDAFLNDFYGALLAEAGVVGALGGDAAIPSDVSVQERTNGKERFVFLLNFSAEAKTVVLGTGLYTELLSGAAAEGSLILGRYGRAVLRAALR
jgi:beta-galactosidase